MNLRKPVYKFVFYAVTLILSINLRKLVYEFKFYAVTLILTICFCSLEGMEYLYWQKYTLEFLCVLISKYKEIFSEVHKGNLEGRPAYPIPYKEYMAEKNIYEPVTFSVCHDYPTAAKEEEEEVFGGWLYLKVQILYVHICICVHMYVRIYVLV